MVALLTEGVGRNRKEAETVFNAAESPSSRRAWVEIAQGFGHLAALAVSPSSRRAWVEIGNAQAYPERGRVALLTEGVGRNIIADPSYARCIQVALLTEGVGRNCSGQHGDLKLPPSRPPHGGRG